MKISLMSNLRKRKYANYRDTHEIITLGKIFRTHFYSRTIKKCCPDYNCHKNLDFLTKHRQRSNQAPGGNF